MPPALGRAPDRSLAAAPAAGSLRRPPATAARLASQCSLRADGAGPGGVRRAQPQQHAALFESLVDQLEVSAVAAPGDLGDLGQHELQILEQALEPRVLGGRRIEHQSRGREQVARLAGELNVDPPGARLGPEARQQGLGAAQVLRRRHRCAFEVRAPTPSAWPLPSCVYPSTSCIRNTVRYPSGKSSIARASRTLRSGSASRPRLPPPPAASRSVSRWRKRFSLRSPFKVTDVAMA